MPVTLRNGSTNSVLVRNSLTAIVFNTLSPSATLGSGLATGSSLENLIALSTRYWTDLSTQRTFRLSERSIMDAWNRYQTDEDANAKTQLPLDRIQSQPVIHDSSLHWVVQEAIGNADIHTWGPTRNGLVTNQYAPNKSRIFITPLHIHRVLRQNGHEFSTLPQSFLDLFNLGSEDITRFWTLLPSTWTLHRTWPELAEMSAETRRWISGTSYFWGDDDGPVSFMPQQSFDSLSEAVKETNIHIVEVLDPDKPNSDKGFKFYKGKVRDLSVPGRFGLIQRKLGMTNGLRGTGFFTEKIIQLIHFGVPFKDIWIHPQHEKLLKFFKQLFMLNQTSNGNIWLQHPALIAGLEPLNYADSNLIGKIGPKAARTLMSLEVEQLPTLDSIFKTNRVPFCGKAEMDRLQLPKILGRTERGRAYQRSLQAVFNSSLRKDQEETSLQQAANRRKEILELRKADEDKLRKLKEKVQHLERDLKMCNASLSSYKARLERSLNDLDFLQKKAKSVEVTAEEIMEELGGTIPDLFKTWIKQNWLILDLKYKSKLTSKEVSFRDDPTLSSNPNYVLSCIVCRTILPNIIRVGAKNDPDWEKRYGKRVGGPYLFEVRPNRVVIKPAEKYTIMGIHPTTRGQPIVCAKLHPHTKATNYMLQDPTHCNSWFQGLDQDRFGICLGEGTVALHQCFQQQDINVFLITLNSWASNADPLDTWGSEATWFPRPEEVPILAHNYSFENQTRIYTMKTGKDNHLFYEFKWRDGISGLAIRHGSMVHTNESWTIPSIRGRSTILEIDPASIETEVAARVASLIKRGYKALEEVNATQTIIGQLEALETQTEPISV